MIADRSTVLRWLENVSDDPLVNGVRVWLARPDTRRVSDRTVKVTVAEALSLWRVRFSNVDITGQRILGVEELLQQLEKFARNRKLEQIAFAGPELTGSLFFTGGSKHLFVGAALVEASNHEVLRAPTMMALRQSEPTHARYQSNS